MAENKSKTPSPINSDSATNTKTDSSINSSDDNGLTWGGVFNNIKSAAKSVTNYFSSNLKDKQQVFGYSVAEIGKPYRFMSNVDPNDRTYKFLSTRMNIVDIYPCSYGQVYTFNENEKKSLFKYGIAYDHAMDAYRKMHQFYLGGASAPSALRIYLTDDSTVTDSISTQYENNFFQTMADKMSQAASTFVKLGRSLNGEQYARVVDKAIGLVDSKGVSQSVYNGVNPVLNAVGGNLSSPDFLSGIIDTVKQGASIVLKGNKLSLPKIWSNSTYSPALSVSTKLFSPYGSPQAIQQFIIKPLTELLLLGVPHTSDLISYGTPFALTVRAWGSSYLTLASMSSITLQRGGSNTAYNIYKQPLVINVNMSFETIISGIAAYQQDEFAGLNVKNPIYEQRSFHDVGNVLSLSGNQNIDGSILPTLMPTIGGLIRSLQPVSVEGISTGYGPSKGTRESTMIGGNKENTGFSGLLSSASTVLGLSGFNAGYAGAIDSVFKQSSFGQLLGGVVGISNDIASTMRGISTTTNSIIGSVQELGGTIMGDRNFRKTGVGRALGKARSSIANVNNRVSSGTNAVNNLSRSLVIAENTFGSLGRTPRNSK